MKPKVDQLEGSFFKPEDFKSTHELQYHSAFGLIYPLDSPKNEITSILDNLITTEEAAKQANLKIVSIFESQDYKSHEIIIELYVLVDKSGQRIYYTGYSEETVKNYQESNFFKDTYIVKLKGELNV